MAADPKTMIDSARLPAWPRPEAVVDDASRQHAYGYGWADARSMQVASAIGVSVPSLFFAILAMHLKAVTLI